MASRRLIRGNSRAFFKFAFMLSDMLVVIIEYLFIAQNVLAHLAFLTPSNPILIEGTISSNCHM